MDQFYDMAALEPYLGGAAAGGVLAILAAFAAIFTLFGIALYIYKAFAWMVLARKLKYRYPWLAWIPVANLFLPPILAKKHWVYGFLLFVPPVYFGFLIYWLWIIYDRRNYPSALALIPIGVVLPWAFIPSLAILGHLIVTGLVAWKDMPKKSKKKK